jgi:perosamine synthetase
MQINKIPHNKPWLGVDESNAVSSTVNSGWIAQGEKTKELENNVCDYINISRNHAVAVTNGTSALFLCLQVLNLPKFSEVIIPSYVCSAVLNAIYLADLTPVLVDVNPINFNLEIDIVESKISKTTRVIIIPHMYGTPVNIEPFLKFQTKGIFIIEDCATAIGAKIKDNYVGIMGDLAIFSFYASKFITTGNGGMVVSKNKDLINKIRDYREFDGVNRYKKRFNFQLTDIQATIGIVQLNKINVFLERRKQFAQQYSFLCNKKGWDYQRALNSDIQPNNYRFVLKLGKKEVLCLKQYLQKENIDSIIPIEKFELLHNYLKLDNYEFLTSDLLSETTLSIPIYPALQDSEFNYIIEKLNKY